MFPKRNIYLQVILLAAFSYGHAQMADLGGIENIYTSIDTIFTFDDNNLDSLVVGDLTGFSENDTVMVYVAQGSVIDTSPGQDGNGAAVANNHGKYAFLIIDEIVPARKLVVLNSNLPEIKPLKKGEVAQLIRVPSYRTANVSSTLRAKKWDGATGGVVALFIQRTLTLNADIDVSATGFRGASETALYTGECASTDPGLYDSTFYYTSNPIRAGLKGEGITLTTFNYKRGKGRNINGGGGGNARLSGGGGGSNWNKGGKGGFESTACDSVIDARGLGGMNLQSLYYINNDPIVGNRIFLGGGGGRGTNISGRISSDGGDGGGIVVIIADSICGNGHSIIADGESVGGPVSGAGGGGGGAGAIILDVNGYCPTLNVRAVGGDGGDTNHPTDTTGPGGGGGGGVYWLAGNSHPGLVAQLAENGEPGQYLPGLSYDHGADGGGNPHKENGLRAPLRGFLFNTVPDRFTICSDQVPETIYASLPKGGDGSYAYEWVDSTSSHSWQTASYGTFNQKDFSFGATKLSDTTWYRRVVTSGILPPDTSFRIAVYVHPAITDNTVSAPDTVCSGNAPRLMIPSATIGGGPTGGTFTYLWKEDPGTGYTDASGVNSGANYQAPGLTETTDYMRIAYSGVCVDTSNLLTVKVWEPLTGNAITPFDTVCYNTAPLQISGPVPGQGDPSDKRYQWESSTAPAGPWAEVAAAESQSYQPPALVQTTYFRRVALSGSDDACVDVSDPVEILNIPLINGNSITADQTVCTLDQPSLLQEGTPAGGGYLGEYSYRWQSRTLSTGWADASGNNDVRTNYNPGIMTGDTTWYRRVVGSGRVARNECLDYSDSIVINVIPSITNNVITTADDVKCQWELVDDILQNTSGGSTPGGGATRGGIDPTRIYKWEVAKGVGTPGTWQVIGGAAGINYSGNAQLDTGDDHFYRRIVFSGSFQECKDTSEVQRITVHTQITGNTIIPADSVCFADTKMLVGDIPTGEPALTPGYAWRYKDAVSNIPDSNGKDYITPAYDALGDFQYQRVASIGECTDTSNVMTITVMQLPGGMLTDNAFEACENDTVLAIDLTVEQLVTIVTPWEVYIKNGVDAGTIGPFMMSSDGLLDISLATDLDSEQFNYEIASITYASTEGRFTCEAPPGNLSGVIPVKVFRKPDPLILVDNVAADSVSICNTSVELKVDPDNGSGMWTSNPQGSVFFTPNPNAVEIFASIPNSHEEFGKYVLTFTSVAGDCFGKDSIEVQYFEQPAPAFAGKDTMIFAKNWIQLNADPPTAGVGTWTVRAGTGDFVDPHDPKTRVYGLDLGQENEFLWTIVNGVCMDDDDFTIVQQNEVGRFQGFSPNGDMHNEYFIMRGMSYSERFSISFFNSFGKRVRRIDQDNINDMEVDVSLILDLKEDERVVWDGLAENGNRVPTGTYYYVVQLEIEQKDMNGNVTSIDTYEYKDYVVVMQE